MIKLVDGGSQWRVIMKNGQTHGIWAFSYGEEDHHYVFNLLVDATAEDQDGDVVITARTPSKPERVMIAVAMIPKADVVEILTDDWDPLTPPPD